MRRYVGNETFMMTYGDGVADIDMNELLAFHRDHGKTATLTAVSLEQRFGVLDIGEDGTISSFREKKRRDSNRVNVGYMVLEPAIFDYIEGDSTVFEKSPLERLAAEGQIAAYRHDGYWQCMDTKREMDKLNELWASGQAPWKVWQD